MGWRAELSGVSVKTVSHYVQDSPGRPRWKTLGETSEAIGAGIGELTAAVYPPRRSPATPGGAGPDETIVLEESHISRMVRRIDKELEELRHILMDTAELADDYPAPAQSMGMIHNDFDQLTKIKDILLA